MEIVFPFFLSLFSFLTYSLDMIIMNDINADSGIEMSSNQSSCA
jgi:hypothetical protein